MSLGCEGAPWTHGGYNDDSRATSFLIRLSHTACQARIIGTIPTLDIKTTLSHRRTARQPPVLTVQTATPTVPTVVQSDLQGVIQSAIQSTIQTVIQTVVRNMLPPSLGHIIRIMTLSDEQTEKVLSPFLADLERALRALCMQCQGGHLIHCETSVANPLPGARRTAPTHTPTFPEATQRLWSARG